MGEFWRRMKYLLNRGRLDRELEEEMAVHREMAARAGAERKSLGNATLLREQAREARGWTWIDRLGQACGTRSGHCGDRRGLRQRQYLCWRWGLG
jgi:hypothetical protein